MSQQSRVQALLTGLERPVRHVAYPTTANGKPQYLSEIYGSSVFTLNTLATCLPKPVFASFIRQMKGRQNLDKATADAIAHAVRIWAMDRGATHFTHWFQPQTDATAEKHDLFLSLKSTFAPSGEEVCSRICWLNEKFPNGTNTDSLRSPPSTLFPDLSSCSPNQTRPPSRLVVCERPLKLVAIQSGTPPGLCDGVFVFFCNACINKHFSAQPNVYSTGSAQHCRALHSVRLYFLQWRRTR